MIAGRGTEEAVDVLISAYGAVEDAYLRVTILDSLEPLAGRLGMKITRREGRLLRTTVPVGTAGRR